MIFIKENSIAIVIFFTPHVIATILFWSSDYILGLVLGLSLVGFFSSHRPSNACFKNGFKDLKLIWCNRHLEKFNSKPNNSNHKG